MTAEAALLAWQLTRPDPRIGDDDFQVFYGGAAAIAAGHAPYVGDFVSPPWFALALVPFTSLPLEAARGVWLAVNLCLLLATTAGCSHLVGLAWPARRLLLAALLLGLWPPVEFGLKLGQNSLLVWALVLAALLATRVGLLSAAGACLALALIKPQLAFLYLCGAAVWSARQWGLARYAGGVVGTLTALALLVPLVAPDSYRELLARPPSTWNYWGSTVALPPLLATISGDQALAVLVYLPVALLGTVLVLRVWARLDVVDVAYLASLTAAATLLLTPYAYPYDAVLLQLPVLWLVAAVTRAPRFSTRRLVPLAVLGVAGWWLLERPGDYTAWRFLGLLPPIGVLIALVRARRALS